MDLVARWSLLGPVRPGAQEAALRAFERRRQVVLPEDVTAYFRVVDGMEAGSGDEELFRFLPLDEMVPITDVFTGGAGAFEDRFIFVDYCISAHFYAIDLGSGPGRGRVTAVFDLATSYPIAPTFTSFIEAYLHSRDLLFGAPTG